MASSCDSCSFTLGHHLELQAPRQRDDGLRERLVPRTKAESQPETMSSWAQRLAEPEVASATKKPTIETTAASLTNASRADWPTGVSANLSPGSPWPKS
jgi:hypothetical protein